MRLPIVARLALSAAFAFASVLPCAARAADKPAKPAAAPALLPADFVFSGGDPATPVAKVDDDVISAGELAEALASSHGQHGGAAKPGSRDPHPMLERLIDARLIVAEAKASQVDQLPDVKEKIAQVEEQRLKDVLRQRVVAGVKADPKKVQRAYEDLVTIYNLHSVNFDTEAGARDLLGRVAKGAAFADAAKAAAATKMATDVGPGQMSAARFDPTFGPVLRRTKPGATTPPTRIGKTWVVAKVLEVQRKEDPAAYAQAEADNLKTEQEEALQRYYRDLAKTHAKVDRALLKRLDYHAAKPGAAALKKDARVVATLDGGRKLTVAELSAELERHFWHGLEEAGEKKRVNGRIDSSFDSLLFRALLLQEGDRLKIKETEEFKQPVRVATDRLLFTGFLESAIAPTIQITDAEARQYYAEHLSEFKTPPLVALELIGFRGAKEAQAGLDRLRAGTDFKWTRANADGVLPAETLKLKVQDGVPVTLASLPEGFAKALAGAKEGDFRLYASPEGEAYVTRLAKEYSAGQQPFEQSDEAIRAKLFTGRVEAAIKTMAKKLREHHQVQVFLAAAGK